MIGTIIQYVLYGILWLTVMLIVTGLFAVVQIRRGADINLDHWLGGLSLIASTAVYVGLFGTVWHIIQALSGIGVGNLNVAAIAKPIGEALYATLWGLASAIPALIGHRVLVMLYPDEDALASAQAEAAEVSASAQAEGN
ncbi:MotA/TolQ/ExbB proton channel family protein [Paraburkholderia sp. EG287A]|uniref:MotA/TolQ/ExbB proton channel family protein n=1 Tax=Paraburkholderia sp. EG287A TaxID=3237012 RepID=UPI0034D34126